MEIERTDIANQFYKGMIQGMVGEQGFPKDPTAAEESMECWTQYIQSVRPDVRVIHLGQTVSKPFYE